METSKVNGSFPLPGDRGSDGDVFVVERPEDLAVESMLLSSASFRQAPHLLSNPSFPYASPRLRNMTDSLDLLGFVSGEICARNVIRG